MALKLPQETDYGFIGDYWKINNVVIDFEKDRSSISIECYKSEEDRENNKRPFISKSIILGTKDIPEIRESLYNIIKATEFFKGATDI